MTSILFSLSLKFLLWIKVTNSELCRLPEKPDGRGSIFEGHTSQPPLNAWNVPQMYEEMGRKTKVVKKLSKLHV